MDYQAVKAIEHFENPIASTSFTGMLEQVVLIYFVVGTV